MSWDKWNAEHEGNSWDDTQRSSGLSQAKDALKKAHAAINEHKKAGPFRNALEAINSPTFNKMHSAIKATRKFKA
jgi:hypothetical protein